MATYRTLFVLIAFTLTGCTTIGTSRVPIGVPSYVDDSTGATVYMLTNDEHRDLTIYQTHAQWAHGMRFFIFHSDRSGGWLPHALELETGVIRPIVPGPLGAIDVADERGKIISIRKREVHETDIASAFERGLHSVPLGRIPDPVLRIVGGVSLSANERTLYLGAELEEDARWALMSFDLVTGEWKTCVELDFKIGHVQAGRHREGVVAFCHETGGDAPQRMWLYEEKADGFRPLYQETYEEWVTHEAWWGKEAVIFTIWPYDDAHKEQPHGIFSVNAETNAVTHHIEYPAWHTHGSPNRRWIMGDDFGRNIWLIDPRSGERTLLSQGHKGEGFNTHPHASFTPDSAGIVFNSSKNGHEDIFLVKLPGR